MSPWSKLEPWEWRAELAKVHPKLTEAALIADGRNVPELAPLINAQKSKEDQVRVCLRYFGDEGHPQPAEPGRYGPAINGGTPPLISPRWGRLPPLDADPPAGTDDLLGGNPYAKADYEAAGKLLKAGKMTVTGIEKRGLSRKRAYRIYRQFVAGAVLYDERGLRLGPGYRWDPVALDNDPPRYKLARR